MPPDQALVAEIAYAGRGIVRPRYHANDQSLDVLDIEHHAMDIVDARGAGASLDIEGAEIFTHVSALSDFGDADAVWGVHRAEIAALLRERTGADFVAVNAPGVLRFSERSGRAGTLNNSRPARFAHVDVSDATAREFAERSCPEGKRIRRFAHYNVWRTFSGAPQDVPLTLCDARSVSRKDLIAADAVFDEGGKADWSFEGLVVAHNPAHRWMWFPDMTRDEVIIFKTNDSFPGVAHCVPHVAFDHPDCAEDWPSRASIEMRGIVFWFE